MNLGTSWKTALSAPLALLLISASAHVRAEQPNEEARNLISEVEKLNSKCRGRGDDPYTFAACYDLEKPASRLEKLDWCFGPTSEPSYKRRWIRCSTDPQHNEIASIPKAQMRSNWKRFSSTTYTLMPEALASPFLSANISEGKIFLNLIEPNSQYCQPGQNNGPDNSSRYLINDTYVKFQSFCINGTRVFGPLTEAGKKLLRDSVESGSTKIEVDRLPPMVFMRTDFESVRRELMKTESAL